MQELQPEELEGLTCPKRPKWSYSSTKKEVEKNEGAKKKLQRRRLGANLLLLAEGLFSKWLKGTDDLLQTFAASLPSTPAPSFYERNLQVWRQLWRVTEASQILLILIGPIRLLSVLSPADADPFAQTSASPSSTTLPLSKPTSRVFDHTKRSSSS